MNTATWVPEASWQVDLVVDGRLRYACGSGLHRFEMLSGRPAPIGQWTQVAVVCDRGDFRIYLNGSQESGVQRMETARNQGVTQPGSDGTILSVGGPGPDALTGFFDGLGDELRFSKVARKRFFFVFLDPLARPGEGRICATHKLKYGGEPRTFQADTDALRRRPAVAQ